MLHPGTAKSQGEDGPGWKLLGKMWKLFCLRFGNELRREMLFLSLFDLWLSDWRGHVGDDLFEGLRAGITSPTSLWRDSISLRFPCSESIWKGFFIIALYYFIVRTTHMLLYTFIYSVVVYSHRNLRYWLWTTLLIQEGRTSTSKKNGKLATLIPFQQVTWHRHRPSHCWVWRFAD